MPELRTCTSCGETKPVSEFPDAKFAGQRKRCNWCVGKGLREFHERRQAEKEQREIEEKQRVKVPLPKDAVSFDDDTPIVTLSLESGEEIIRTLWVEYKRLKQINARKA